MSLMDDARPDVRAMLVAMQQKLDQHDELLEKLIGVLSVNQPALREIIDAVAEFYDIEPAQLRSGSRLHTIAIPRMIIYYLARRLTRLSLTGIAQRLGRRDHTTVMSGIERITRKLHKNELLRDDIDVLRLRIAEKVSQRLKTAGLSS
jgi:chromosomal replication initiator protein